MEPTVTCAWLEKLIADEWYDLPLELIPEILSFAFGAWYTDAFYVLPSDYSELINRDGVTYISDGTRQHVFFCHGKDIAPGRYVHTVLVDLTYYNCSNATYDSCLTDCPESHGGQDGIWCAYPITYEIAIQLRDGPVLTIMLRHDEIIIALRCGVTYTLPGPPQCVYSLTYRSDSIGLYGDGCQYRIAFIVCTT